MNDILKNFKLRCSLQCNSTLVDADVEIEHYLGCSVRLLIKPDSIIPIVITDDCYLTPISNQDWQFNKSKIYLKSIENNSQGGTFVQTISASLASIDCKNAQTIANADEVSIRFYLVNFPTFIRINNPIINLIGYSINLQLVTLGQVNRIVLFENVRYDQYGTIKYLIEDICWLTSFACGGLVSCSRVDIFHDNVLAEVHMYSPDIGLEPKLTITHNRFEPDYLRKFIESCHAKFRQNSNDYSMRGLIHLGLLAKHSPYIQAKVLIMSNFLEVLRYNYVLNVGVSNGVFAQSGNDFLWVAGTNAGRKASFKQILEHFCNSISLSGWNDDFKDLRNNIVHTGRITGADIYPRYAELHHFCDRVIMALLEYDQVAPSRYIPINCPCDPSPRVTAPNWSNFRK